MDEDHKLVFQGKKILITGGLGFIGSNLAIRLLELKPERIIIVDSLIPECGGNEYNIHEIRNRVEFIRMDITNEREMDALIRLFKPDFVFSLAGLLSHDASLREPKKDAEINAWAQYNILEPCRKSGHEVKIIYAGTRGQYGKDHGKEGITEEMSTLRPADPNGISKNAGEQACLFYGDHFPNIKACSLRMTNTYGPRHQMRNKEQGFLNWFIRLAMDNKDLTIYEPGTQLRDFNYVDDVVEALLMAMASDKTNGQVYNLGSCLKQGMESVEVYGNILSVKDVAQKIVDISNTLTGSSVKCLLVPYPEERKKVEVGDIKMDFTKFNRATGWKPQIDLAEGIKRTIDFYIKNKGNYW